MSRGTRLREQPSRRRYNDACAIRRYWQDWRQEIRKKRAGKIRQMRLQKRSFLTTNINLMIPTLIVLVDTMVELEVWNILRFLVNCIFVIRSFHAFVSDSTEMESIITTNTDLWLSILALFVVGGYIFTSGFNPLRLQNSMIHYTLTTTICPIATLTLVLCKVTTRAYKTCYKPVLLLLLL